MKFSQLWYVVGSLLSLILISTVVTTWSTISPSANLFLMEEKPIDPADLFIMVGDCKLFAEEVLQFADDT